MKSCAITLSEPAGELLGNLLNVTVIAHNDACDSPESTLATITLS